CELFFDGTGYAGTNNVIPTVTTLTNLPSITAGWLTATGIAADAITAAKIADGAIDTATFASGTTIPRCTLTDTITTYTGDTPQTGDSFARIGATGSGLTSLAPSATALSTVNWTTARAGYLDNINNSNLASVPAFPSNFAALGINASGHVSRVVLVDTLTTYTGNTVQTGDSFARIGAAGAGLTDLGGMSTTMKAQVQQEAEDALAAVGVTTTVTGRIDAAISTRMATYTQPTGFLAATFP